MLLFPAIDLYQGQAVRLTRGDYAQMTVYDPDPVSVARTFARMGARCVHLVDLEGARDGTTPNSETVREIVSDTHLFSEIGGGIRNLDTVETYLQLGVDRVILGTAAVTDEAFLIRAVKEFSDRIAVGADIRDGFVAIRGWTETTALSCDDFCRKLQAIGVKTLICTDISRDGVMKGANRALYAELSAKWNMQIVASGGISTLEDIQALRKLDLYGAIIGKAYYTGAIDLQKAIEVAR